MHVVRLRQVRHATAACCCFFTLPPPYTQTPQHPHTHCTHTSPHLTCLDFVHPAPHTTVADTTTHHADTSLTLTTHMTGCVGPSGTSGVPPVTVFIILKLACLLLLCRGPVIPYSFSSCLVGRLCCRCVSACVSRSACEVHCAWRGQQRGSVHHHCHNSCISSSSRTREQQASLDIAEPNQKRTQRRPKPKHAHTLSAVHTCP